ncbi:MAG: type VI immunity family protein [Myxococcota bacterium]
MSQVILDLTAYLVGPTVDELDLLVDLYRQICPPDRFVYYAIAEQTLWDDIDDPELTKQGRAAARQGMPLPFLAPVYTRIRDDRPFELQFWDGLEHDSFAFSCHQAGFNGDDRLHSFVRFSLPLSAPCAELRRIADVVAQGVNIRSGHGGLCFSYDGWRKHDAFTYNYGRAKRWWGVDLEDLNGTLPQMVDRVKGAQWLTLLGSMFTAKSELEGAFDVLNSAVEIVRHPRAMVLQAGPNPSDGDQHRRDPNLDAYLEVARAIEPVTVDAHSDFAGDQFLAQGDTLGWLRRFTDPDGWR